MKPMIVLPPKTMSPEDIAILRDNGLCVVVATDPAKVRFIEAIPDLAQRSKIDHAAIKLSRIVLNGQWGSYSANSMIDRGTISKIFVDVLTRGTELDANGGPAEIEKQIYDQARTEEIRKIAREDARKERVAKKAAKPAQEQPAQPAEKPA